jgi:phosphoesterase RecJ-like protein
MSDVRTVVGKVAAALAEADRVALACHVGPDGDALGSMLALALALDNAGKEVVASFGSPFSVPSNLEFLPTDTLVPPADFPNEPDLMVVLDTGSADRIGELAAHANRAGTLIVIDHHVTNEGFGDISLVEPTAAATGELVYRVLEVMGCQITPAIALCLHTALVTDTGRFSYSNTKPETLRIAAELLEAGSEPSVIGRHVYEEAPFGYLKALAIAMDRAELDPALGVVSTWLSDEDLKAAGIDWGDTDNLIDVLRLAVEADTAVLAKAHSDGRVKVSLRSRGDTDVGGLAQRFGGGGHRLAAGFTGEGEVREVLSEVAALVESYR